MGNALGMCEKTKIGNLIVSHRSLSVLGKLRDGMQSFNRIDVFSAGLVC